MKQAVMSTMFFVVLRFCGLSGLMVSMEACAGGACAQKSSQIIFKKLFKFLDECR